MLTLKDRVPAAAQVDAEFAWSVALLLGLIFTLGMLTADAANGLWVYRLIAASGEGARRASRGLTLAIALLSLALAMIGLARLTSTGLDGWYDANTLPLGFGSVALLAAVYLTTRVRPAKITARPVPTD